MSRFVDVEPIIKDLTAMKSVYDAIALDGMIKALREAPTADVVEVVHATWREPVFIDGHWYRICSHCLYGSAHGSFHNKDFKPNYCSNCGAKMDREEQE